MLLYNILSKITMKKIILLLVAPILILSSCSHDDSALKIQEQQQLDALYLELISIASSVPCTNSENWTFTAVGSKGCGGPTSYLAYPLSIDTVSFLEKVSYFTSQQEKYNAKWNPNSYCLAVQPPTDVVCVDGKPTFIY